MKPHKYDFLVAVVASSFDLVLLLALDPISFRGGFLPIDINIDIKRSSRYSAALDKDMKSISLVIYSLLA